MRGTKEGRPWYMSLEEEIKVNIHSQLDKGSAWATGTLHHTTHRNKPGIGRHLVTVGATYHPTLRIFPHVPSQCHSQNDTRPTEREFQENRTGVSSVLK